MRFKFSFTFSSSTTRKFPLCFNEKEMSKIANISFFVNSTHEHWMSTNVSQWIICQSRFVGCSKHFIDLLLWITYSKSCFAKVIYFSVLYFKILYLHIIFLSASHMSNLHLYSLKLVKYLIAMIINNRWVKNLKFWFWRKNMAKVIEYTQSLTCFSCNKQWVIAALVWFLTMFFTWRVYFKRTCPGIWNKDIE